MRTQKLNPANQKKNQAVRLLTNGSIAEPTHDEVALAAYSLWESEGRPQGNDLAYWLRAEELLRHANPQAARRA
jgi:hypothetical protein